MAAELVLAPEAEEDLALAYDWLESHRLGLGEDFLARVDACLRSVRRNPLLYPVVHEGYRRALVRRFPYAVFYEHTAGRVVVYAIPHTARDPLRWRERLI